MRIFRLAVPLLTLGAITAPALAQDDEKMMKIVGALNTYTDCLTTHALELSRKSQESAETLVRAAKPMCNLAYLDAATAYANSGIIDVPASAQQSTEDRAIAAVVERRAAPHRAR